MSNTLDSEFCLKALNDALKVSKPDIFNTDQGSQFTSQEFFRESFSFRDQDKYEMAVEGFLTISL